MIYRSASTVGCVVDPEASSLTDVILLRWSCGCLKTHLSFFQPDS